MMVKVKPPVNQDNVLARYKLSSHFLILGTILFGTCLFILTRTGNKLSSGVTLRGMLLGVDAHLTSKMINKPHLVYGTAWKKEETARLVSEAVKAGFRFIDTACQPKHYNEAGVGNGWTAAAQELGLSRSDMWLQVSVLFYSVRSLYTCIVV